MNRVLLSFCFLFAACGEVVPVNGAAVDGGNTDGDGGTGPDATTAGRCDGPSIALADMETCFRQIQCEYLVRCFPGFPSVEFCEPRIFDFFSLLSGGNGDGGGDDGPSRLFFDIIARADMAGVASYDGTRAYSCLDSFRESACKSNAGGSEDCEYIITGSVANGGECFDDYQCLQGASCVRDGLSCSTIGVCQMGLSLGQDCSNGQRCLPELDCVGEGGGGGGGSTCEDGTLGSKCNGNSDCDPELNCQAKLCVADVGPGGSCTNDDECPGDELCVDTLCGRASEVGDTCRDRCFGNLYCDSGLGKCRALPGPTEACGAVPAALVSRCSDIDHSCAGLTNPTCRPRTSVGMLCGSGPALADCALGSFCSSELGDNTPECTAPLANTASCNAAKHCDSGYCAPDEASGVLACDTYKPCWE